MEEYAVVGRRIPRIDSLAKATGAAKYTGDLVLPGMLYGKVLHSPYAHARILNIDTSKAERLPGIKAVVTGKDATGQKFGIFAQARDQYLLAKDKVRFEGEEVAAVAAIDEDIAEEALSLIRVEYEELPFVLDPLQALEEDAPRIHEHAERNIGFKVFKEVGNVEEAFQHCDYIFEGRFSDSKSSHNPIEPYCALAHFDPSTKMLNVWGPNQGPFGRAKGLSNTLGIPLGNIRVQKSTIGGCFGGRSDTFPCEFCASLLSMKARRPVRIIYSREETMVATRHVHSKVVDYKVGVRKDGTIVARDMKAILDGGAYLSSGPIATGVGYGSDETRYKTENIRYEAIRVYTNKTPCSMARTNSQAFHLAADVMMDTIAEKLGMDPMELRLKNIVKPGDRLPGNSLITSCAYDKTIKEVAREAGWKKKRGKLGPGRGIGMGCGICFAGFNIGFHTGSSAYIKFNEDGTATLFSGNVDNGQGNESMLVQIAAEELGIPMEDIRLVCADTGLTPHDPGSYSQSSTFTSGNAVKAAAADARQQLLGVAADVLTEMSPLPVKKANLVIKDRRIYIAGSPEKGMRVEEAVKHSLRKRGNPVIGTGEYIPSIRPWATWYEKKGQLGFTYTFATLIAEVEVERDTGQIKLLNLWIASDSGMPINPTSLEGAWQGFAVYVQGNCLYEKLEWDKENGHLITNSMMDYKIPTTLDIPNIQAIIVESDDPEGPYGAKESSSGMTGLTGAIANAVYDAVGIRIKELPITPEYVLKLLREKEVKI